MKTLREQLEEEEEKDVAEMVRKKTIKQADKEAAAPALVKKKTLKDTVNMMLNPGKFSQDHSAADKMKALMKNKRVMSPPSASGMSNRGDTVDDGVKREPRDTFDMFLK